MPKLRFKGFTDDWEQRKLGDVAKFINGRAYSQDELLDNGKYKVLRVGNFYTNDSWYFSDMELEEKYYANDGDLLYTWSATFGPHIWHGDKVIYHYHIWKVDLSDKLDKMFALQLLEQDKAALLANTNGSTMVHVTKAGMEEKHVLLPTDVKEQAKSGEYLCSLDNLIALHQRKCEALKEVKKYMLQKMFPKKGEKVPEIRFAGFTGDWEQRKLGDIIYDLKSGLSRELKIDDIGLPVVRANNIDNNKLDMNNDVKYWYKNDPQGADTSNYFVHKGDILINFINSEAKMGTASLVTEEPARDTIYTTNILRMRTSKELHPYFFLQETNLSDYKCFIKAITKPAVNQASFTTVDYKKYDIKMPVFVEQEKIGRLFQIIDNLITLYQSKQDTLKEIKKYMLQNMFPKK